MNKYLVAFVPNSLGQVPKSRIISADYFIHGSEVVSFYLAHQNSTRGTEMIATFFNGIVFSVEKIDV